MMSWQNVKRLSGTWRHIPWGLREPPLWYGHWPQGWPQGVGSRRCWESAIENSFQYQCQAQRNCQIHLILHAENIPSKLKAYLSQSYLSKADCFPLLREISGVLAQLTSELFNTAQQLIVSPYLYTTQWLLYFPHQNKLLINIAVIRLPHPVHPVHTVQNIHNSSDTLYVKGLGRQDLPCLSAHKSKMAFHNLQLISYLSFIYILH